MSYIGSLLKFLSKKKVLLFLFLASISYVAIVPVTGILEGLGQENLLWICIVMIFFILHVPIYILTAASILLNARQTRDERRRIRKTRLSLLFSLLFFAIAVPYFLPSRHTFTVLGECWWVRMNFDVESLHRWLMKQDFPQDQWVELPKDKWPNGIESVDKLFTPRVVNGVLDIRFLGHGMSLSTGGIAVARDSISVGDLTANPNFGLEGRKVTGRNLRNYALVWYGGECQN